MYQSRTPERCDHRSAYFTNLVARTERGYRARYPQCGTSGPVQLSTEAARRALVDSGREAQGR
jgi:3-oxoacyl-[acyl-carrier-protein] synthase III